MLAGINILEWLPETPVSAVGYNVNFHTNEPSSEMLELLEVPNINNNISGLPYDLNVDRITKSLTFESGLLNLTLKSGGAEFSIHFNFHKASNDCKDLIEWLKTPVNNIKSVVENIIEKCKLEIIIDEDENDE